MMAGFITPLTGALLHNLITAVSVANAAKLVGTNDAGSAVKKNRQDVSEKLF